MCSKLRVPCYLSKPLLLLLLLIGLFGMGEKSWGAGEKCGEVYAGIQGTCVLADVAVACPSGTTTWNTISNCTYNYKCCISETENVSCTTKLDGDKCVLNGKRKTCKNGFCGEQECKTEDSACSKDGKTGTCKDSQCDTSGSSNGKICGEDKKGTCRESGCPEDGWSKYPEGSNYCQPDEWTEYVCCIADGDVCAGKSEGAYCKTNDKDGNCISGKCETGTAKPGQGCGDDGGTCIATSDANARNCKQTSGGRSCEMGSYCAIDCDPAVSCGTNNGTCKAGCDSTSGEKEDTSSPQCSSSSTPKCCYTSYEATDGTTNKDFKYKNPLNANTFTEWAETVLTSVQSIVGWLAVIMLMIGGIVYLTSAGTNQATLGKDIITAALIGFAVVIAGPSLLKEIKDVASTSGSNASSAIDGAKDIKSIITSVLEFLLASMGTLALIGFAVGGVFYLTAFGDKGKAETGKKMAINSLYAIALAGGGLILVNQILSLLGG